MREPYTTELALSSELTERLNEALEPELLRRWGVDDAAPSPHITTFAGREDWIAGIAHSGIIELRSTWLEHPRERLAKVDAIQAMYLHEYTHILTPGHGHDAVFFAVEMTLYRRAFVEKWTHHAFGLYDFQDDVDAKDLAHRITWAIRFSERYAPTPFDGPELATLAKRFLQQGADEPHYFERQQLEQDFQNRAKTLVADLMTDIDRENRAAVHWEKMASKATTTSNRHKEISKHWRLTSAVLGMLFLGSLFIHL